MGRGPAGDDDVAFVQLHADCAGHVLLSLLHEGVQRLAQRGIPLPIVHQFGIALGDHVLVVQRLAVQAQRLQLAMGDR